MSDNTDKFDAKAQEGLPRIWKCTQKGRVVYKRSIHPFRSSDLHRIARITREYWPTERQQELVAGRLSDILTWIQEYLRIYHPEPPLDEGVLSAITARLQDLTKQIVQEILEGLGVPTLASIALSEKMYNILYGAVSDALKLVSGGRIHGEKNR